MTELRVSCTQCNNKILPETAIRNGGLCGVCKRKQLKLNAKSALETDISVIRYADEFQTLREMTKEIVRSAWNDLVATCNAEQIYGLCIYAYHTGGPPVLCVSMESGFAERESKLRANTSFQEQFPTISIQELVHSIAKWSPNEWEHEAYRWESFRPIVDYLGTIQLKNESTSANELHAMILASYVAVLLDLDNEGVFSSHRESSSLILFCSVCESSDQTWYEHSSAKLLNAPDLFQIFYNESIVYNIADEEHNRELIGDERQRRFYEYIKLVRET